MIGMCGPRVVLKELHKEVGMQKTAKIIRSMISNLANGVIGLGHARVRIRNLFTRAHLGIDFSPWTTGDFRLTLSVHPIWSLRRTGGESLNTVTCQ